MIHNVPVGVDTTDHIAFFCPICNNVMVIKDINTVEMIPHPQTKALDKCTWIYFYCPQCQENKGHRKFYWTTENGENCTQRTDKPE